MLVFRNSNHPIEEAGALLCSRLRDGGDAPKLFLASGGSSLSLLDHIDKRVLGPHLTVSVLDERFSRDSAVNNFSQITTHVFYERAVKSGCSFIDTRPLDSESCGGLVKRFEKGLRDWKEKNPKGTIIATQGIAQDGHTAGIMPMANNPELFRKSFEDGRWVVGYHIEANVNPYTERITTTLSFLREMVDFSVGFAVDENKREILQKVLDERNSLHELPARIMQQMKNVIIVSNVL